MGLGLAQMMSERSHQPSAWRAKATNSGMDTKSFPLNVRDGMAKLHQHRPQRPTPMQSERPHAEKKDSLPRVWTTNGGDFGKVPKVPANLPSDRGDAAEDVGRPAGEAQAVASW